MEEKDENDDWMGVTVIHWALLGVIVGTLHELWALDIGFIISFCTWEMEIYPN